MTIKILTLTSTGGLAEALAQEIDSAGGAESISEISALDPLQVTPALSPQVRWLPAASIDFRNNLLLYALLPVYAHVSLPGGLGTGEAGALAYDSTASAVTVWTGSAWRALLTTALAQGAIWVGNSADTAVPRLLGGDLSSAFDGLVTISRLLGRSVPTPNRDGYILGYNIHTDSLTWVFNGLADPVSLDIEAINNSGAAIPSLTVCTIVPGSARAQIEVASAANIGAKIGRGFAVPTFSNGATGLVKSYGIMDGFSGLTPGAQYYLDPAVAGGITSEAPQSPGSHLQRVGVATLATQLFVSFGPSSLIASPEIGGYINVLTLDAVVPDTWQTVALPDRRNFLTGPLFPDPEAAQPGDLFYNTILRELFISTGNVDALWISALLVENTVALHQNITAAANSVVAGRLLPFPEDFLPCYLESIELRAGVASTFDTPDYWSYRLGSYPLNFTDPVADFAPYGSLVTTDPASQVAGRDYRVHIPVNDIVRPAVMDSLAYKAQTTGAPGPLHLDFATLRYRRLGLNTVSHYQEAVLASAPLAYWRFNELTGPGTVVDYSGNGKDATVPGGTSLAIAQFNQPLVSDAFNLAYRFPGGVNSYFEKSFSELAAGYVFGTTVTLEFWVYLNSFPNVSISVPDALLWTDRYLFSFHDYSGNFRPLVLTLRSFGGLYTGIVWGDTDEAVAGTKIDQYPTGFPNSSSQAGWPGWLNTWVHVAAVAKSVAPVSGTPPYIQNTIYINGSSADWNTVPAREGRAGSYSTPTNLLTVGNSNAGLRDNRFYSSGWTLPFYAGGVDGYLDEVAIYNRELTADEVLAHYNAR